MNKWFEYDLQMRARQEKWDRRYMELAKHVSQWSKDPSTKVGAVLVNPELHQEFVGYNGFARGVDDTPERLNDRETKYKFVVHAEVNAILKAGAAARGSTLYVWPSFAIPNICHECAKVAVQAGITRLVGYPPDPNNPRAARWGESISVAQLMFDEARIQYVTIQE
jgi:dCMP deaminase